MPERKTSFRPKQNTCHSLLTCKSNIVSQLLQSDNFSFFSLNFFWSSSFQSTKCLATTLSSCKCAASDCYMGVYKTWPTFGLRRLLYTPLLWHQNLLGQYECDGDGVAENKGLNLCIFWVRRTIIQEAVCISFFVVNCGRNSVILNYL